MKYAAAITLVVFFSSCQKNSVTVVEPPLNQEFQLSIGQEITIMNENLTVKFTALAEDSRCPNGAICVWQGNGRIALELQHPRTPRVSTSLNTTVDPQKVVYSSYEIRLKQLSPYPELNNSIPPEKYIATLVVARK